MLQRKCKSVSRNRARQGSGLLQRAAIRQDTPDEFDPSLPMGVHEVLRSPGQPLDEQTRSVMEPAFGHDFTGVRVHTDGRAATSAQAVNARAYTVGHNVVF